MDRRTMFTIVSMINIIWYTIVVLTANFMGHIVQTDLTVAWFSAWTVELGLLFGIRLSSKDQITPPSAVVKDTEKTKTTVG